MMLYLSYPPMAVVGRFSTSFVCMSVCFSAWYVSETYAAKIAKFDMFCDEPWKVKTNLFWGQWSRSRVTKTLPAWVFALLWVLACSSYIYMLLKYLYKIMYEIGVRDMILSVHFIEVDII